MTKILIFSTAYFPFIGGAEVAVQRITDHIEGVQFDMITVNLDGKQKQEEYNGSVKIYRVGNGKLSKYFLPWTGYKKARELHLKNNYDAAWSIMASQASIAASLFKIFNKKVKLILTLQEGDEEKHLARYVFNIKLLYKIFIRPWHRLVFKKADVVTVISEHLKKRAIRNRVDENKIKLIPNAVDIHIFSQKYNKQKPEITRKTLNIEEDEKVIVTVSRLVKKNGLEYLIDAVGLLSKEQKIKLIICGTGDEEEKLKKQTEKNNIKDRVLFLGNIDHKKEVPQYLWLSDVFCRPSLSEGLGNVFLEAMAAGLPVIATPVGGIPDFLKDGQTGWFCKVRDPKSIAEKVKYILDEKNKEEVERVKENAKKLVEEKYNWANIVKKMEEVFKN